MSASLPGPAWLFCPADRPDRYAKALAAASPGVVGLMWGAEDLIAALGGRSSRYPDGGYRDVARYARSVALLAAGAYGRAAIDAVYIVIDDLTGLACEADDAVASGFTHKACIHPSQTQVIWQAFRPTPEEVAWARRVVEATASGGVTSIDGRMIDSPLIRQAQRVLAATDHDAGPSSAEPGDQHADRKQTGHPPTRSAL